MTMMTNDELIRLLALCESATSGGINVHRFDENAGEIRYQLQSTTNLHVLGCADDYDNPRAKHDAALWSVARTQMIALIEEVNRLRAIEDAAHNYRDAYFDTSRPATTERDALFVSILWKP